MKLQTANCKLGFRAVRSAEREGISAVVAALLLLTGAGCGERGESLAHKPAAALPAPVATAFVREKPMDLTVRAIGAVEPMQKVSIRAQVTGILTKIAFQEGDEVREGQLLFEIDPRSFEADLKRAEATLARDQAQMENTERQAKRYEELVQKDFVTKAQYDDARTGADVLRATVNADKQAVENARLQLERATLRSPINGRTGNLLAHEGDAIKANDAPLVVINQIKPILVRFAVPSDRLPEIQKYSAATNLQVVAGRAAGSAMGRKGVLCFVNNEVDSDTGTVLLKARFENADSALWPGQYMDVELVLTTEANALTVPAEAVQPAQDGLIVLVVKSDMTVEKRIVVIRRTVEGTAVVSGGLAAGEQVVTDGQLRLVPGAKVEIRAGQKTDEAKP